MSKGPRFFSTVSRNPDGVAAAHEIADALRHRLPRRVDLAVTHFTADHVDRAAEIAAILCDELDTEQIIGCSAAGVISGANEIEQAPAVCLVAAQLPNVAVRRFQLDFEDWRSGLEDVGALREACAVEAPKLLLLLAEPFSTPTTPTLEALEKAWPALPAIGGLASAANEAGGNALICGRATPTTGLVGLAIGGSVEVDLIVSQGCRPVGPLFEVTDANRNLVMGLDGRPPLEQLQALVDALPEDERAMLDRGLLVGRPADRDLDRPGRGDFLIRNLVGVDRDSGILAISDLVERGEHLQFHLLDAVTASEDLALLLSPQAWLEPPAGGLMFSCNGRGSQLHGRPDADVEALRAQLGDIGLGGCFCAGEIGPIGGRNHVHGHTLAVALFRAEGKSEGRE